MANSKYVVIALLLLPIIAVLGMIGLVEVFLAGSIGLLGGSIILLKPEVEKAMKKGKIERLYREHPLDLVVTCNRFFLIAFFGCLANIIMVNYNFGVGNMPFGSDQMLFLGTLFFVFGVIFLFRVGEFILRPNAKTNIVYGKIAYWFAEIMMRVCILSFVVLYQILTVIMFYGTLMSAKPIGLVFDVLSVVSFVSMFPLIWGILFRVRDKFKRKDIVVLIGFFLPWIYLFGVALLLTTGILN